MLELYTNYLICSTSYTTATGLSNATNKEISHDKITRFLSSRDFTGKDLWEFAKSFVRSIEKEDGALIIDDSIEEKPYTNENELITWHYDHSKNCSVKGINFVSALYESEGKSAPVAYNLVKKNKNKESGKKYIQLNGSKHDFFRNMIKNSIENEIKFKYVLSDSWYASSKNMEFIHNEVNKLFIMPLKSNRLVALSEEDKKLNLFVRIDSLEPGESTMVWLNGVSFPLRLNRLLFKNGDDSTGVLYLVSNNIELTNEQIETIYKRRWKVEEYHKSLKNNVSLAKSPTKTARTQANHLFAALCGFIRLEAITIAKTSNHYAIKDLIYIAGLKAVFKELEVLKNQLSFQMENFIIRAA